LLEPQNRQLLLDALRPPADYQLDRAIGTTYSLDLISLLAAPLGFALLDREGADGRLVADPIALLEAVRRNADRIDVFCQAGKIAIPRQHRSIFGYLESSVHEVVAPNREAIFHPKVWVIRYRHAGGRLMYRMLCLSRNLTLDSSWDTVLQLDGERGPQAAIDPRLPGFVERLPELAVRNGMPEDRRAAIHKLADELRTITFKPPEAFDRLAFWPLGLEPDVWPFGGLGDRLLVVSPFLTAGCISRLHRKGARDIVVSRTEAFDLIGAQALARIQETLVLSSSVRESSELDSGAQEGQRSAAALVEAIGEASGADLSGLHAKLYVSDLASRSRVWTGSANATDAAFGGNVEFLVELEGPKSRCGIDAVVGHRADGVGMRQLLEQYSPAQDLARELTAAEDLDRRLDELCRAMARRPFVANVQPLGDDVYSLRLEIGEPDDQSEDIWSTMSGVDVRVRPLSVGDAFFLQPVLAGGMASIDFGRVSFAALTSFFVVRLEVTAGDLTVRAEFVVNADLLGAPEDRRERTLVALLGNGSDLVRLLALLLGALDADDMACATDLVTGERSPQGEPWLFVHGHGLLEPMVRALANDPQRLDQIHRLVGELESTESGRRLLPSGWHDVWEPIWQARQTLGAS
jgi:hypothetical protein